MKVFLTLCKGLCDAGNTAPERGLGGTPNISSTSRENAVSNPHKPDAVAVASQEPSGRTVNTVLGPIPASELGVVAVHEALLSVLPGAQYAPDISMDRADIFSALAEKLADFRRHGGQ